MVCDIHGIDSLNQKASYSFGHCSGTLCAIVFRNRWHVHFYHYWMTLHPNRYSRRSVPPFAAVVITQWTIVSWWCLSCRGRFFSVTVGVVMPKRLSLALSCHCPSHSLLLFFLAPIDDVLLDACPNVLFGMSNCSSIHCGICNDLICGRLFVVCYKQHSNAKKLLL